MVTLSDLAPILAAVLGPMLAFAVAVMRFQHVETTKMRELIEQSNQDNRDLILKSLEQLTDVRERLARIEGHLRIPPPPHQGASDDVQPA